MTLDAQTWLDAAQYYAALGLPVFPLRGKVPLTQHGHLDASLDPEQWRRWVNEFPGANIGIQVPVGKIAIDIDPKHGGDAQFEELERQHGETFSVATFAQRTGSGGYHFVYDAPPGARYPGAKLEGCKGLDIKQQGLGYLVAAPSIHPDTGRPYELCGQPTFAPLPTWLGARLTSASEPRVTERVSLNEIDDARKSKLDWGMDPDRAVRDVSDDDIARAVNALAPISGEGSRYTTLVKTGGLLSRLGWAASSVELFARAYIARYGGRDVEHGVRGCLSGMTYPSGYHALLEMLPVGDTRDNLRRELDALANPYGEHLRETRTRAASDVLAKAEALTRSVPDEDEFFGWLAARTNGPPPVPLIAGLDIADGYATSIAGLPHAGKTPFAMSIALAVATGKPWLGRETQRRPVLYLNFEKGFDAVGKRERLAAGVNVDPESLYLLNLGDKGAFINDRQDTLAKVVAVVKRVYARHGLPPMLLVDTLANAVSGVNHNDAAYAEPIREVITSVQQVAPCAVVILSHCRKSLEPTRKPTLNDVEGSGQIAGLCSAVIGLYKPDANNANRVTVASIRALADELPPITIEWRGSKDEPLTCVEHKENAASEALPRGTWNKPQHEVNDDTLQRLVNVVEAVPDGFAWQDAELRAATRSTGHRTKVRNAFTWAVQQAIADGLIEPVGGTPKKPAGYRKVTLVEREAQRVGFARSAELQARSSLMLAEASAGGLPDNVKGVVPPPIVGGFTRKKGET